MPAPYQVVIIDDEPIAIQILASYVKQIPELELLGSFSNALDALALLNKNKADLLLLDIEMPGISGLDFAKSLPHGSSIIFTTAYRNYAVEAFDLAVVDYLLKPIPFPRFLKAIQRFYSLQVEPTDKKNTSVIEVRADKKNHKLPTAEIVMVESFDDYIKIHTNAKRLLVHERMHQIEKRLGTDFLRIHRSYLINKQHVVAYSSHEVELKETKLPIGRSYRETVAKILKD